MQILTQVNLELTSGSPKVASTRCDYLDALRGFAILGVLSIHCAWFAGGDFRGKPFADAGVYGVQLFFTVSAFTIFMTLERAMSRGTAVVRSFYIRRIMRILPMFWVAIVLYAFAPGRERFYTDIHLGFSYYALTAILQHGWHPDYFNAVVPGSWTIAVEGTFYLIAPFLLFRIKNWQGALYFLLASLFFCEAASYGLRMAVGHHLIFQRVEPELMQRFAQKWFPSQLPVFACGILAFYILKTVPELFRSRRNGLALLIASLMILYNAVDIGSHRLLPEQVVFALGFMLLILALAIYPMPLIVNSATGFLGRISYSFYLVHFVVMAAEIHVIRAYLPGLFAEPPLAYFLLFAVTLALATPVSWATYRFIEQPFIRLGTSIVRRLDSAMEWEEKNRVVAT